jgi:DNA polymerase V
MACGVLAPRGQPAGHGGPVFHETGVVYVPGCPLLAQPVPAGFPSPATDYVETRLSLDEHLVEHEEATFFVRVKGNSMVGFGINDGDLLVVDRSRQPGDRCVVIAVVDGQFMVKQACRVPEGVLLRSSGPGHGDILVGPEQEIAVWGVVTWALHKVK